MRKSNNQNEEFDKSDQMKLEDDLNKLYQDEFLEGCLFSNEDDPKKKS